MSKQQMMIYGCGGAGTNLAHQLQDIARDSDRMTAYATMRVGYIDSSTSNKFDDVPDTDYLFMPGVAGSGGIRGENADQALSDEFLAEILRKFPPADINILVHSAGGGTGGVIAYGLAKYMAQNDIPFIGVFVGSRATRNTLRNTGSTIKSYDNIVQDTKTPIALLYRENSDNSPREAVDNDIREALVNLAMLFSGNNRELDTRDLQNWLRYDRFGSHQPAELVQLCIFGSEAEYAQADTANVTSVATLAAPHTDTDLRPAPEVQFVGFLRTEDVPEETASGLPIHFTLVRSYFAAIMADLDETSIGHKRIDETRVRNQPLSGKDDKKHKSGLVM